jgi:hypothetical protein
VFQESRVHNEDENEGLFSRLDSIQTVVDSLFRAISNIRNLALFDHSAFKTADFVHYEAWDINHVRDHIPSLSIVIATRLGRAMARKRLHIKYALLRRPGSLPATANQDAKQPPQGNKDLRAPSRWKQCTFCLAEVDVTNAMRVKPIRSAL